MASPALGPGWFPAAACLARVCMGLCGVAAGATRSGISSHFALHNNLADVAAKEGAQETAVSLAGLLVGLLLTATLEPTRAQAWVAFLLLTALHVVANLRAVSALRFRTLNMNRADVVLSAFADAGFSAVGAVGTTPTSVRAPLTPGAGWCHPCTWLQPPLYSPDGRRRLWVTLVFGATAQQLSDCMRRDKHNRMHELELLEEHGYVTAARWRSGALRRVAVAVVVALQPDAPILTRLAAYFEAVLIRRALLRCHPLPRDLHELVADVRDTSAAHFPALRRMLQDNGWDLPRSPLGVHGMRLRRVAR